MSSMFYRIKLLTPFFNNNNNMFNTSFIQLIILFFLVFLLFGDVKKITSNFLNLKTFFKNYIKKNN